MRISQNRAEKFLIDTLSITALSFLSAMALELLLGWPLVLSWHARLRGTVVNVFTGGLYGLWRDWMYFQVFEAKNGGRVRRYFAEIFAYLPFQTPLCILVLVTGAHNGETIIWVEVIISTVLSPIAGPILGWFMMRCRKWFRINNGG